MSAAHHATSGFRISGLPATPFQHLFDLSDDELAVHHAKRYRVDQKPGFPDRIELRDAEIGESVLLVNYSHLPEAGPYQASHAVFVIEGATATFEAKGSIPELLRSRMLSLRAFADDGMMVDADLVEGRDIESSIERFFADPRVTFIHVHYARRGCYACRIDRIDPGLDD